MAVKNKIMLACSMGILSVLLTSCSLLAGYTKVTVKVVDEDNTPVDQANVEIGFRDMYTKEPGKGWGTGRVVCHPAKGKTDSNGLFSASDNTSPNVVVTVTKEGYYESNKGVFNEDGVAHEGILTVVLRKKINPVAMYAKKQHSVWKPSKIPVFNQDVGYDLEAGDWVAPHGKGKTTDFVFNVAAENKDPKKDRKCVYSIKFTNEKDGIQEYNAEKGNQSVYRWPYEAPEDGYSATLEKYNIVTSGSREKNIKNDNEINYIYRVRTKTDEKGKILQAKYGKINGEITVFSDGDIQFAYYFNPSGNRSLEFDVDKNLFIPQDAGKYDTQYRDFTGFEP